MLVVFSGILVNFQCLRHRYNGAGGVVFLGRLLVRPYVHSWEHDISYTCTTFSKFTI